MKNKIIIEIVKVVITAVATALGMTVVNGCSFVPVVF